jgi:hypothetical protein
MIRKVRLFTVTAFLGLACGTHALAQDPFEIHVYEYQPLKPRSFTLETHLNYVGKGTREFEGTVAPFNDQFHMTYELTGGITNNIAMGFMLLTARRPGDGLGWDTAGVRILPHFYVPESWGWPVKVGLIGEFSFEKTLYAENDKQVEIRPIIEKSFGKFQIDLNPAFQRALHGPGTRAGWAFSPAARVAYHLNERWTPSLEYYSETGPFPTELDVREQVHQFLPGADLKVRENVLWSFGVGIGSTPAGNRLVYKSRIEIEFGGKKE